VEKDLFVVAQSERRKNVKSTRMSPFITFLRIVKEGGERGSSKKRKNWFLENAL
jgi:hypothetical protein